jgi:hypothetical protein
MKGMGKNQSITLGCRIGCRSKVVDPPKDQFTSTYNIFYVGHAYAELDKESRLP